MVDIIGDIKKKISFTPEKASRIAQAISEAFKSKIEAGVQPSLKERTVKHKRDRGYERPETPLYATGEMSSSLVLGNFDETSMEIISKSSVNPLWHIGLNRASGVPQREVLTASDFTDIITEALKNG